jgi:hypothetical protein
MLVRGSMFKDTQRHPQCSHECVFLVQVSFVPTKNLTITRLTLFTTCGSHNMEFKADVGHAENAGQTSARFSRWSYLAATVRCPVSPSPICMGADG